MGVASTTEPASLTPATEPSAARSASTGVNATLRILDLLAARGPVGLADLEASYKPSAKATHEARVVKAEADYAVAKQHCDDKAGNAKDVCIKEAKAAEAGAKADAKAAMKSADANSTAKEKKVDARKEAAADKTDARYAVDKEQCDAMAGAAKDHCLDQAKLKYAK